MCFFLNLVCRFSPGDLPQLKVLGLNWDDPDEFLTPSLDHAVSIGPGGTHKARRGSQTAKEFLGKKPEDSPEGRASFWFCEIRNILFTEESSDLSENDTGFVGCGSAFSGCSEFRAIGWSVCSQFRLSFCQRARQVVHRMYSSTHGELEEDVT
jgi:hypothetical protein